ncbi:MAG: c-type cytochrome [Nannocystis sp.]|nr:c-type cytochrome [Nannocystis sp.]
MSHNDRTTSNQRSISALLLASAVAFGACGKDEPAPAPAPKTAAKAPKKAAGPSAIQVLDAAKKFFSPLPARADSATNPATPEKIALGRALYYDTRLSKNQEISCNTCHQLDRFGVDGEPTSPGHRGQRGDRNSPTVYNAATHFVQFWDGRAADVEEQALGPILNPVEMAVPSEEHAVKTLRSIPGYKDMFAAAFPGEAEPVTFKNIGKAIGAFERGLITPGPFDDFLGGNMAALSPEALRGLQYFIDAGCTNCHAGPSVGGTMYQKLGTIKPYVTADEGRFKLTNNEADKFSFKVPGLRNIVKTAPYLHDGSAATLDDVINVMVEYQVAKGSITDDERRDLTAFLEALTGNVDAEYIKKPELPESGPETPKPDPA